MCFFCFEIHNQNKYWLPGSILGDIQFKFSLVQDFFFKTQVKRNFTRIHFILQRISFNLSVKLMFQRIKSTLSVSAYKIKIYYWFLGSVFNMPIEISACAVIFFKTQNKKTFDKSILLRPSLKDRSKKDDICQCIFNRLPMKQIFHLMCIISFSSYIYA